MENYTFKIEGFTPASMPFGRLLEYYQSLCDMLGSPSQLHLMAVVEGSHSTAIRIDDSYKPALAQRLQELVKGTAPTKAHKAREQIDQMLEQDNARATFSDPNGGNVIEFLGASRKLESSDLRVNGSASFVGELYHISRQKDKATLRVSTKDHGTVYCTSTIDIAKALTHYLFDTVRVTGLCSWRMDENRRWFVDGLEVTSFDEPSSGSLRQVVQRLRALDIQMPSDAVNEINRMNEDGETQH
jgi:hypothetical protein